MKLNEAKFRAKYLYNMRYVRHVVVSHRYSRYPAKRIARRNCRSAGTGTWLLKYRDIVRVFYMGL